jgi:putative transcriptional regulator
MNQLIQEDAAFSTNPVWPLLLPSNLNTSESTIEKWETGAKQPSGMALKLLAVVQKHALGALV